MKKRKKFIYIVIFLLLLSSCVVFFMSHETCLKYNDWWIIGRSYDEIVKRYGEFDYDNGREKVIILEKMMDLSCLHIKIYIIGCGLMKMILQLRFVSLMHPVDNVFLTLASLKPVPSLSDKLNISKHGKIVNMKDVSAPIRKSNIFIICMVLALAAALCTSCDGDVLPYKSVKYDLDYSIAGNIFLITDIEDEITNLVREYNDDVILTQVIYSFESAATGNVTFKFCKEYIENGKYREVLITMYADMDSGVIYEANYEEGSSKRVMPEYLNQIDRKDEDAQEIYIEVLDDEVQKQNNLAYVDISFGGSDVAVRGYDENDNMICDEEY